MFPAWMNMQTNFNNVIVLPCQTVCCSFHFYSLSFSLSYFPHLCLRSKIICCILVERKKKNRKGNAIAATCFDGFLLQIIGFYNDDNNRLGHFIQIEWNEQKYGKRMQRHLIIKQFSFNVMGFKVIFMMRKIVIMRCISR